VREGVIYTAVMPPDPEELAYYRTVEDFFATLRGVPHMLSPKDMHLLRTWWGEGVPLAAVTGGLAEVFARRRDRGEEDPVVSLSYCRHAVRRHAAHLAEMRAGGASLEAGAPPPPATAIAALGTALQGAARELPARLGGVARVIAALADHIGEGSEMPAAAWEEHLFALESALLEGCWAALPPEDRELIEAKARAAAERSGASGDALERALRAMRDRVLRETLGLPRLEL